MALILSIALVCIVEDTAVLLLCFGLYSGGHCCNVTVLCDLQLIFEGLWSNQTLL